MKHKLLLVGTLIFVFALFGAINASAQEHNTLFVDNLINVKHQTPKKFDYSKTQKKIKKNRPKVNHISKFDCQGYNSFKSNKRGQRQKVVLKNRKQYLKKVLALR